MKKRNVGFIFFWFLLLTSCHRERINLSEQYVGDLVFNAPSSFRLSVGRGLDSYVAYLVGNEKDTFHIEYGSAGIIYNFYEISPHVLPLDEKDKIIKQAGKEPTAEDVLFSEYPQEDEGQKIFDRNYFMYDTINGIVTKLVQPKRTGNGITGIYIPKLRDGKSFSMYAINLDSAAHKNALQMFKTIRYK